jgi:hypothetical protein
MSLVRKLLVAAIVEHSLSSNFCKLIVVHSCCIYQNLVIFGIVKIPNSVYLLMMLWGISYPFHRDSNILFPGKKGFSAALLLQEPSRQLSREA